MMTQQPEALVETNNEAQAEAAPEESSVQIVVAEPVSTPTSETSTAVQEATAAIEAASAAIQDAAASLEPARPPIRAMRIEPKAEAQPDAAPEAAEQPKAKEEKIDTPALPTEVAETEAPAQPKPPAPTPMALTASAAHGARKPTKHEAPSHFDQQARAAEQAQRAARVAERSSAPAPARSEFQGEAKYATYSQSEIDHMLKQQADSILQALSGKVAAQQRAFQEAIVTQEKAFNKLADSFLTQYDVARVKLEGTAKQSQEATKAEMEEFHRQLSKELNDYRSQISKSIAKVNETNKNQGQPKEANNKQVNVPNKVQAAINAGQSKLQNLIFVTLLASVASLVLSAINLMSHAH